MHSLAGRSERVRGPLLLAYMAGDLSDRAFRPSHWARRNLPVKWRPTRGLATLPPMRTLLAGLGLQLFLLLGCGVGELSEAEKRDFERELARLYQDAGTSTEGALDE